MTWKELCKKAKEMGYELEQINGYGVLKLKRKGIVVFEFGLVAFDTNVFNDKTPDQMFKIMEAFK